MRMPSATVAAVASLAAAVVVSGCSGGSSSGALRPDGTPSSGGGYEKQVEAVIQDWGSIAVQGMRPAIADLDTPGGVPRAGIATEADAWTAALKHDRDELVRIIAPTTFEPTRHLLLQSLDAYLHAAAVVHAAAEQRDARRRHAALERAVQVLSSADQLFDRARPTPG